MDGLLIIDKPEGITSHDAVNRVRRVLGTRRVGHTGTLDPFATGVMVVVVGKATRLAQFLDKDEKEYEAVIRFGFETDTGDRTGSPKSEVQSPKSVSRIDVESILGRFIGEIEQIPPMYSAKKIDGKKLYEHARNGETVERKPIGVIVNELQITSDVNPSDFGHGTSDFGLRIVCSAGTYIRVLAEEIGRKLGVGAHLAELRRTRSGRFSVRESITLDKLEKSDDPSSSLLPVEDAVRHLEPFDLDEDRAAATANGLSTRISDQQFEDGQTLRMLSPGGDLIAVGVFESDTNSIRPRVVLV
ncbi:MAG: tRNA pseudouridine(55) synthase TruB [Acidobacteria bacterium]|nr:tRNA pseudouridine(55) synthase TruB [Acidobacteriota bacterium]